MLLASMNRETRTRLPSLSRCTELNSLQIDLLKFENGLAFHALTGVFARCVQLLHSANATDLAAYLSLENVAIVVACLEYEPTHFDPTKFQRAFSSAASTPDSSISDDSQPLSTSSISSHRSTVAEETLTLPGTPLALALSPQLIVSHTHSPLSSRSPSPDAFIASSTLPAFPLRQHTRALLAHLQRHSFYGSWQCEPLLWRELFSMIYVKESILAHCCDESVTTLATALIVRRQQALVNAFLLAPLPLCRAISDAIVEQSPLAPPALELGPSMQLPQAIHSETVGAPSFSSLATDALPLKSHSPLNHHAFSSSLDAPPSTRSSHHERSSPRPKRRFMHESNSFDWQTEETLLHSPSALPLSLSVEGDREREPEPQPELEPTERLATLSELCLTHSVSALWPRALLRTLPQRFLLDLLALVKHCTIVSRNRLLNAVASSPIPEAIRASLSLSPPRWSVLQLNVSVLTEIVALHPLGCLARNGDDVSLLLSGQPSLLALLCTRLAAPRLPAGAAAVLVAALKLPLDVSLEDGHRSSVRNPFLDAFYHSNQQQSAERVHQEQEELHMLPLWISLLELQSASPAAQAHSPHSLLGILDVLSFVARRHSELRLRSLIIEHEVTRTLAALMRPGRDPRLAMACMRVLSALLSRTHQSCQLVFCQAQIYDVMLERLDALGARRNLLHSSLLAALELVSNTACSSCIKCVKRLLEQRPSLHQLLEMFTPSVRELQEPHTQVLQRRFATQSEDADEFTLSTAATFPSSIESSSSSQSNLCRIYSFSARSPEESSLATLLGHAPSQGSGHEMQDAAYNWLRWHDDEGTLDASYEYDDG